MDLILHAIAQQVDLNFLSPENNPEFTKKGLSNLNGNTLMTSLRGAFAGWNCVTGPATFIQAMAQGQKAAPNIDDYLIYGRVHFFTEERMSKLVASIQPMVKKGPIRHEHCVELRELDPEVRKKMFEEAEIPISVEELTMRPVAACGTTGLFRYH